MRLRILKCAVATAGLLRALSAACDIAGAVPQAVADNCTYDLYLQLCFPHSEVGVQAGASHLCLKFVLQKPWSTVLVPTHSDASQQPWGQHHCGAVNTRQELNLNILRRSGRCSAALPAY